MCGFIIATGDYAEKPFSDQTKREIRHRGPDGDREIRQDSFQSFFARLAVVGLEANLQPIESSNGSLLFCNGEIYNFESLIEKFELSHFKFSNPESFSDVDVLAELIDVRGIEVLSEVVGMLAVVHVDSATGTITAARDALGEKPLFYHDDGRNLVFSSSISALAIHLGEVTINKNNAALWFQYGQYPVGLTLFDEIKEVKPGQIVKWSYGIKTEHVYWAWPSNHEDVFNSERFRESISETAYLISRSDIGLGVALSSGLDSQLVGRLMVSIKPDTRFFFLRFENSDFDESGGSLLQEFQLTNPGKVQEIFVDRVAMKAAISEIIQIIDSPCADPSTLAMYCISREVRASTRVILTGDGGDELFRGYAVYSYFKVINRLLPVAYFMKRISFISKLIERLLDYLLQSIDNRYLSLKQKLIRFLAGLYAPRDFFWATVVSPNFLAPYLTARSTENSVFKINNLSDLDIFFQQQNLPQLFLQKADRASMASGVEVRPFFTTRNLVELVSKSTAAGNSRALIYKPFFPQDLHLKRVKKRGLGVPLQEFLEHVELPEFHLEFLEIRVEDFEDLFDKRLSNPAFANLFWSLYVLNQHIAKLKHSGVVVLNS